MFVRLGEQCQLLFVAGAARTETEELLKDTASGQEGEDRKIRSRKTKRQGDLKEEA